MGGDPIVEGNRREPCTQDRANVGPEGRPLISEVLGA